jgi:hypothetical protein
MTSIVTNIIRIIRPFKGFLAQLAHEGPDVGVDALMLPELGQRLELPGALGALEDGALAGVRRQVAVERVRPWGEEQATVSGILVNNYALG